MGTGILGVIKSFLKFLLVPALYIYGYGTMLYALLKRASWGMFLLVFLIPQPNVWHKLYKYPLGTNFIDLLYFSILLGIIIQKKGFLKNANSIFIMIIIGYSYFSIWNSSLRFSLPLPITVSSNLLVDFKNYAQMLTLYYLALNIFKDEEDQKKLIILISIVLLIIAVRAFRSFSAGALFSYDKRVGGPFEAVGLGANHTGAFFAHFISFLIGLFIFDINKKRRLLYLGTMLFGIHPLFFSFSRGAYLAIIVSIFFFGITKKKSLLVFLVILFFCWQTVLPSSVVDRITMTESPNGKLEHSAGGRLDLWEFAFDIFMTSPIVGVGTGGYGLSVGGYSTSSEKVPEGFDTHSLWMRTLSEQGIIGFILLFFVFFRAFQSGWKLYSVAATPFQKGLGYGFAGCIIAASVSNLFGDRWTYFVLGGYIWTIWGIVDRSILNLQKLKQN